jgi:hypothetical protein
MLLKFYDAEFDIPEFVIEKFIKDFDGLAGGKNRESVLQLRYNIEEVLEAVAEDPEMLYDYECRQDFLQAIAMQHALKHHGVMYDA